MKAKTVLIGITGGIAAVKVVELVKGLKKRGVVVKVVMTRSARHLVDVRELEKVSGNKVYVEMFEKGFDLKQVLKSRRVEHIDLVDEVDLIVIVPATANVIAKLASGMADDFLTTTVLAAKSEVMVYPSMNSTMWLNPMVQENVTKLQRLGMVVVGPDKGPLACGVSGVGRLPKIEKIVAEIVERLAKTDQLKGKKVMVTAGATREKIDEVRYITNPSSGKMGVALAEALYQKGAEVVILKAKGSIEPRFPIKQFEFETSEDLLKLVKREVKKAQVMFQVAAVGDFRVKEQHKGKLSSKNKHILELVSVKKIVNLVKKINPRIRLFGFKAVCGLTTKQAVKKAREVIKDSEAEAVMVNEVSKEDIGFESDDNQVMVVTKDKVVSLKKMSKRELGLELVQELLLV